MRRVKTCVRYFLAWSSGLGAARVYNLIYSLLIAVAVRAFRRTGGAMAVYLTRGCVKREILPGVSDIDFLVVVSGDARERERVQRTFDTLQSLSAGLIPSHPSFVMTPEELRYRWDSSPYWRYRLQEGKSNWRLLHGRDYRTVLPEIGEIERKASCAAEVSYWWVQFVRFVLHGGLYAGDSVMRNSICYKAVAEVLNARRAMRDGEYCYSKADALRRENSELASRLLAKAEKRYLGRDRSLEEATYRFLTDCIGDLWRGFEDDPFLEVYSGVRQSVDLSGDDRRESYAVCEEFERHVVSQWGERCRSVRIVRSAFWPMEDRLLIVDVQPSALPGLDELDAALRVLDGRRQIGQGRLFLFLKAGSVAFPLTPEMPRDFLRGVLTAATAPDVFLQLGEERAPWTDHAKWYLTDWQRNRQWVGAGPMKQRQLEMIARGAAASEIVYPLTESAIGEPA